MFTDLLCGAERALGLSDGIVFVSFVESSKRTFRVSCCHAVVLDGRTCGGRMADGIAGGRGEGVNDCMVTVERVSSGLDIGMVSSICKDNHMQFGLL